MVVNSVFNTSFPTLGQRPVPPALLTYCTILVAWPTLRLAGLRQIERAIALNESALGDLALDAAVLLDRGDCSGESSSSSGCSTNCVELPDASF